MLAYLEQQPLYNAANFSFATAFNSGPGWRINTTVYNTIISTFLCPSDNLAPLAVPPNDQWNGRLNDYYASVGTTLAYQGNPITTGVFNQGGRAIGVQNITDGTSNTIAFAEAVVGPDGNGGGYQTAQTFQIFRNGTNVVPAATGSNKLADANMNMKAVLTDMNTCQKASQFFSTTDGVQGSENEDDKGARWAPSDGGWTLINTVVPPSSTQFSFACCNFTKSYGCDDGTYENVNSMHPGGANVLFADGSVHFIKSSISIATWWALGTKANGEVISSDSY